jgi:hypothetical protein
VSVDREQVRKVIDLFSTVYQDLGELAPTYENDHLVVKAYELARVAGEASLFLRNSIGDSGFREVDDLTSLVRHIGQQGSSSAILELIPRLSRCLVEAKESATEETFEILSAAESSFRSGLAELQLE